MFSIINNRFNNNNINKHNIAKRIGKEIVSNRLNNKIKLL